MTSRVMYSGVAVWLGIVALVTALGAITGVSLTMGILALALLVGLVPPAIMFKLSRAAPESVAEMLRHVDRDG
jgi:hypothetical protein